MTIEENQQIELLSDEDFLKDFEDKSNNDEVQIIQNDEDFSLLSEEKDQSILDQEDLDDAGDLDDPGDVDGNGAGADDLDGNGADLDDAGNGAGADDLDGNGADLDDADDGKGSVDYKQFYEQVTAPFKASKVMEQYKTPEKITELMQKGQNYSKNMERLKPMRTLFTQFERANIKDQEDVAMLISAYQGDKGAIAFLINRSGTSLESFDVDEETNTVISDFDKSAKAKDIQVSDSEIEFNEVVDGLNSDPKWETTSSELSRWDSKSKSQFVVEPKLLPILNDHVKSGIFQTVMGHVEELRSLGEYQGVPTIDVYNEVCSQMSQSQKSENTSTISKPKSQKSVIQRRNSSSAPITGKPNNSKVSQDIIGIQSDKEFLEAFNRKYKT